MDIRTLSRNKWKRAGIDRSCWNCGHAIHIKPFSVTGTLEENQDAVVCVIEAPDGINKLPRLNGAVWTWCSQWRKRSAEKPIPPEVLPAEPGEGYPG